MILLRVAAAALQIAHNEVNSQKKAGREGEISVLRD
jgi:hypothetical protein